jgi:hypothetical protein
MLTRQLERSVIYRERVPKFAKQMWVFVFVFFTWVFFRAGSLADAWLILGRIFSAGFADPGFPLLALGLVLVIWAYQFMYDSRIKWLLSLAPVRVGMVVAMILYIIIFSGGTEQPFIYFQF